MSRSASPQPLDAENAALVASRFAALSEPMRLRLIDALRLRGEASVQQLAEALEASHANVSKHLGVLHAQRIVGRRKAGTRAIYRITDESVLALCDQVCGAIQDQFRELLALVGEVQPHPYRPAASARLPDRPTVAETEETTP